MESSHRPEPQAGDVAKFFDGQRLTLARHLAGLRKNALAEMIGKTPTAVAAYENNSKRPATATVAQISLVLGVPPAFFLPGPGTATRILALPHFRSLRATTQIARDQASAYGQSVLDVAVALERHVEFPELDISRLHADFDETEISDIPEKAARILREHWGAGNGPIRHLVRLSENHGVLVVFSPIQTANVDAYSFEAPEKCVIVLNPAKNDYYRQRFDVAHELGHLVMHPDTEPGAKSIEDQAHRFAAEFLMPEDEIRESLPSKADWRRLGELKETWGVSLQALLYRARSLGVMGDVTYRNAISYLSAKGWRRREPGVAHALEQPSLLPRAVELLGETGVDRNLLAREARVPLPLFETITSRKPGRDLAAVPESPPSNTAEYPVDTNRVVSLFDSRP